MKEEIKVIYKEPLKDSIVMDIKNDYKVMQDLVKGLVEVVPFPNMKDIDVLLNEEGKIYHLTGNIFVKEYNDIFVGPMIVVKEKDGQFVSLNENDIKKVNEYLKENDYMKFIETKYKGYENER